MRKSTFLGIVAAVFMLGCYALIQTVVTRNVLRASAYAAQQPYTVVIDAGHGGDDGGAVGISGTLESQINLSVALRLEQVLRLCGIKTSMVRTQDLSVETEGTSISEKKTSDLKQRVKLVQQTFRPILVSIHQNHFSDSKYYGAQVFYAKSEGSHALASLTQQVMCQALDPNNRRQCKQSDSVYLLENIQCPGILVECGFLSNRVEEQKLCQESYQTKIACAIGSAVARFLEEGEISEI